MPVSVMKAAAAEPANVHMAEVINAHHERVCANPKQTIIFSTV